MERIFYDDMGNFLSIYILVSVIMSTVLLILTLTQRTE